MRQDPLSFLSDELASLKTQGLYRHLRVLEDDKIRRLGETRDIKIDVRIITATHRDLTAETKAGRFREDLFYRLNVLPIHAPPLRERKDDIPLLIDHFITRNNTRLGTNIRGLDTESRRLLYEYSWPGNVRELENTIERAMVLAENKRLDVEDLPPHVRMPIQAVDAPELGEDELSVKKHGAALERRLIQKALERTGGNRTRAADLLELSSRALLYKIREYGLE